MLFEACSSPLKAQTAVQDGWHNNVPKQGTRKQTIMDPACKG